MNKHRINVYARISYDKQSIGFLRTSTYLDILVEIIDDRSLVLCMAVSMSVLLRPCGRVCPGVHSRSISFIRRKLRVAQVDWILATLSVATVEHVGVVFDDEGWVRRGVAAGGDYVDVTRSPGCVDRVLYEYAAAHDSRQIVVGDMNW